ncbi:hypothetical protein Q7355_10470, partial [Glaesserella parasuis]|nr:hypothetical protein [Glaesserella parasuis]
FIIKYLCLNVLSQKQVFTQIVGEALYPLFLFTDFIPQPPSPSLTLRDFPHKWGKNFLITPLYNTSPSPPILPPLAGEGARRAEGGRIWGVITLIRNNKYHFSFYSSHKTLKVGFIDIENISYPNNLSISSINSILGLSK